MSVMGLTSSTQQERLLATCSTGIEFDSDIIFARDMNIISEQHHGQEASSSVDLNEGGLDLQTEFSSI